KSESTTVCEDIYFAGDSVRKPPFVLGDRKADHKCSKCAGQAHLLSAKNRGQVVRSSSTQQLHLFDYWVQIVEFCHRFPPLKTRRASFVGLALWNPDPSLSADGLCFALGQQRAFEHHDGSVDRLCALVFWRGAGNSAHILPSSRYFLGRIFYRSRRDAHTSSRRIGENCSQLRCRWVRNLAPEI